MDDRRLRVAYLFLMDAYELLCDVERIFEELDEKELLAEVSELKKRLQDLMESVNRLF